MQSRLTQQFILTLKGQKLGANSVRTLQTKQQLIKVRPGTNGLDQLLALSA